MPLIKLNAFHTVEGLFVIKPLVDRLLCRRLLFLGCQNSGRSNRGFSCSGNQSQFKNARSFFLVNSGILSRYRVKRPRKAWEGVPRPPCQFYNKQLTKKSALAYADLESKARTSAVLLRSTVELNQENNEKALNTSKGTEWSRVFSCVQWHAEYFFYLSPPTSNLSNIILFSIFKTQLGLYNH